ncbi:MAG: hypothetical protein WB014_00845 [Methanosarcina sp.]
MKTIKMKIINEAEIGNKPLLNDNMPDKNAPPIVGTDVGNANYTCGKCGKTLAVNIIEGQITNTVVKCQVCDEFNLFE